MKLTRGKAFQQVRRLRECCVLSSAGLCDPRGLWPAGLLCPWDPPGKNPGAGCHFLLQGIFLTQGSNPGFLHSSPILY